MEKINYQKQLDSIVSGIRAGENKPGLLLHSCCGPCSSYCLLYLKDYFKITVYYYNPNIYPLDEYIHRFDEQSRLINDFNRDYSCDIGLISDPYDHNEFLDNVKGLESEKEGGKRCSECFRLRLKRTAELAHEMNMDYFGTTLTVSPHKNAVIINSIGLDIAGDIRENDKLPQGMPMWLPSDFKKNDGYKKSIELSKKYGLYRQNYCGCEFSIWF